MQKKRDFSTAKSVAEAAKKIIFLALIVLVGYKLISASFAFGRSLFYVDPAESAPGTDMEVTVAEDDDLTSLGEKLYQEGIITNTLSFRVQGTLYKTALYPGDYTLNTSMTIKELLTEIESQAEALEESEAEAIANADIYSGYEISGGDEGEGDAMEDILAAGVEGTGDEGG